MTAVSPNPYFRSIQRLARETGGDVQELLTLYVLERFLARLASSPFRDDFVLKGGVLLAAFDLRRPTRDIDLQATRISNEEEEVLERVREIASRTGDDGVIFDTDSATAETIRDQDEYSGIRVRIPASLGKSAVRIGIDVSFGDPIWPTPRRIEVPSLLTDVDTPVVINGYPLHMVVAEKTVTALQRGEANTRWRDFADILTISRTQIIESAELHSALNIVAQHREQNLNPLLPELGNMSVRAQQPWVRWRSRQAAANFLPELFEDVLRQVSEFVDPVIEETVTSYSWNPHQQRWESK